MYYPPVTSRRTWSYTSAGTSTGHQSMRMLQRLHLLRLRWWCSRRFLCLYQGMRSVITLHEELLRFSYWQNQIPNTLVMRIPPKRSRQGRLHADHAPTPVKSIARHAFARSTVVCIPKQRWSYRVMINWHLLLTKQTPPMSAQRLRKDGLWDLDNRNFCYVASAKHIICITTCTCKIRNLLAF